MTEKKRNDRLSRIVSAELQADSLVGSYFHSDAERGWQGCVVAEVAPAVYLVETLEWLVGDSHDQRLVRLDEMRDWCFYDDANWMRNAYEGGVAQRWERERGEDSGG